MNEAQKKLVADRVAHYRARADECSKQYQAWVKDAEQLMVESRKWTALADELEGK